MEALGQEEVSSKIIGALVTYGADVNARHPRTGLSALMTAIHRRKDDANTVRILLRTPGIDVKAVDSQGNTLVLAAIKRGQGNVLDLLLAVRGMKVNKAKDEDGYTALALASSTNDEDSVRRLLEVPMIRP